MKRILIVLLVLTVSMHAMEQNVQYAFELMRQKKLDAKEKLNNAFLGTKGWLETKGSEWSETCSGLWHDRSYFSDSLKAVNEKLRSWMRKDTQKVAVVEDILPADEIKPEHEQDTVSISEQNEERLFIDLEGLSEKNVDFMWKLYDQLKKTQEENQHT